jgi:hypothetical protein
MTDVGMQNASSSLSTAGGNPPFCFAVSELLLKLVLNLLTGQQLGMGLIQLSLEVCLTLIQLLVQCHQIIISAAHCLCNSLLDYVLHCSLLALLQDDATGSLQQLIPPRA